MIALYFTLYLLVGFITGIAELKTLRSIGPDKKPDILLQGFGVYQAMLFWPFVWMLGLFWCFSLFINYVIKPRKEE